MPTSNYGDQDRIFWLGDKSGIYTVKKGYKEKCDEGLSNNSSDNMNWRNAWKLNIPPKVRTFCWKLIHYALF